MITLVSIADGRAVYDFNQAKSLAFIYGGNTDYYITANIYKEGTLEEDKSLMFVIDKTNIDFYNVFDNFFEEVKKNVLTLNSGQSKLYFPPYIEGLECHNYYDIHELYDSTSNRINWPSEAGNGPNKDTIMYIEQGPNDYRIIFKNEVMVKYNDRFIRNVCVCNSGSRSDIFPYLYWNFFNNLKNLDVTMTYGEAEVKILKK